MVHRVKNSTNEIQDIYFRRDMVIHIEDLCELISKFIDGGFLPGTIMDAVSNLNIFHLTFDDGYVEQLHVIGQIRKKFGLKKDHITVAVNVGNSLNGEYTGMDRIYLGMTQNKDHISSFFPEIYPDEDIGTRMQKFKEYSLGMSSKWHRNFHLHTPELNVLLSKLFLNAEQINELDNYANIACHGLLHRDLTYHTEESLKEINQSKESLEHILGHEISTICYPEGKSNQDLQEYCRRGGFTNGLSIRNEIGNNFCIGRYCVVRHKKELMRLFYG